MAERQQPPTLNDKPPEMSAMADSMVATAINTSRRLISSHNLTGEIHLFDPDDALMFQHYLVQRMLRTSVYDSSWLLSNPAVFAMSKIPGLNRAVKITDYFDRKQREGLVFMEDVTNSFKNTNFQKEEAALHARTIELAVNDLVARGTINDPNKTKTKVKFTPDILTSWVDRWREQLETSGKFHIFEANSLKASKIGV